MNHLDRAITDIETKSGLLLTDMQRQALREAMASYALAAVMDSFIRKEAEQICQHECGP